MSIVDDRLHFFHLPRELRDNIYDYAFGPTQRSFSYGRFVFILSPSVPQLIDETVHGLPSWLLTSRSICKEATDLLIRSRYISPCCQPRPLSKHPRLGPQPWYPPLLTWHQRLRLRQEEQQRQELGCSPTNESTQDTPQLDQAARPGGYIPPHRRDIPLPRQPHETDADEAASIPTCSPIRQSLLLHENSVRNIALVFPVRDSRTACYHHRTVQLHDVLPLDDFLAFVQPFVHPSNLWLATRWQGFIGELDPYFEWPEEWSGRFRSVDVTLACRDYDVEETKERIEELAMKLVGRQESREKEPWRMEPVWIEPVLPLCEVHGEACVRVHWARRRRSEVSRYKVRIGR